MATVHRTVAFTWVRVRPPWIQKREPPVGVLFFWCTKAIQIRTGIVLYGFFHIIQGDGSGAVLVVEGENQLIIIQINGVHKGINQHFAVRLLVYIQLAEFVQPEGDELRADSGLGDFFVGDLDFQIFLRSFQFLQAGLGGFGEDALLDGV